LYDLIVAGAGMAGLSAAAHATSEGASVLVFEKGDRIGGSMLLSSGVIWRYRDFPRFRVECPGGDERLQRTVHDRFDEDLRWLESLGAPVCERDTGNPLTTGVRFETEGLTRALAGAAGEIRLNEPLRSLPPKTPVILATGGFQGNVELVREYITMEANELQLRANPWSSGDGLRIGLAAGASLSDGMDEFYGRNMPAPPARLDRDRFGPLAQLYAQHCTVENSRGDRYRTRTWSEIDVTQWTARQLHARAWYRVPDEALGERVRDRTVADMIETARRAGGPVSREGNTTVVEVVAGITATIGGLRAGPDCGVAERLFACGADIGGISTGGYASGLAAALVLGRIAAESALSGAG
jgi:succinate dehydrogenase/fumarate reductase flavoprotein subunit